VNQWELSEEEFRRRELEAQQDQESNEEVKDREQLIVD